MALLTTLTSLTKEDFLVWLRLLQVDAALIAGFLAFTLCCYSLSWGIYNRYFHPLKDIPGPFWASVSNFWLYRSIDRAKHENYALPIHKKYGKMVRLAPNHITFSDPEAIEIIYGPKHDFPKSEFYLAFDSKISKTPDSFSCLDGKTHYRRRRAVAPFYTQAAVLQYEPCVDRIIDLFHARMEGIIELGETTDMALWFRKYTFDIIGEMFYGRVGGFGFVRENVDYNNWGKLLDVLLRPLTASPYAPLGLKTVSRVLQMLDSETRAGVFGFFEVVRQSREALKERLANIAEGKAERTDDILSKLIKTAQSEEGEKWDFGLPDVSTEIFAVIFAGADTTSTALTAIFYYVHKTPHVLPKLRKELDEAFADGRLTWPIRYADANKLPYLHAVVNEAMRIHPSTGMSLPRSVPEPGVEICGTFFPAGTEVAMNAAVVQFDKGIYGEDSEEYILERWIRDGERAAANMDRHLLQFGYGRRICLGKHISYTEMFKLVPTLLHHYDFEFTSNKPWTVTREWMQHQKDVNVKIKRRDHVLAPKAKASS